MTKSNPTYPCCVFDSGEGIKPRYDELCAALQTIPATSISLDGCVRVTDWRWSLTPLSPLGSIKGVGGRFNIGDDLDRYRIPTVLRRLPIGQRTGSYRRPSR
jgi:hypothetical protein